MNEQKLYEFSVENIHNLIRGDLSLDKIQKLREIDFDFNYYIDEYLERIASNEDL